MLERFIYEDHLGRRFDGLSNGVYMNYNDLRDYTWNYDRVNDKISRFFKAITSRKLPLMVKCDTDEKAVEVKNRILDLSETDIAAKLPGKVYVGEYYSKGYITGSKKGQFLEDKRLCKLDLTFTSDDPSWYREQMYPFVVSEDQHINSGNGTDYPYDYPYDYAVRLSGRNITCDTIGNSAFKLSIYGAANNPTITIGGHTYAVNGSVNTGETLIIDGLAKTITLVNASGRHINWFDKRSRESYIFEPIPSGMVPISWSGQFGFDLTVIEKRSEPRWI